MRRACRPSPIASAPCRFKASLLARLSGTDYPALAELTTRSDDDYTIALCDAFAGLGDVLTFYQERIANEIYRTATERRSVLELARLIGYHRSPGVAASTWLAFTLQTAPGQPAIGPAAVVIPVGTRLQERARSRSDAANLRDHRCDHRPCGVECDAARDHGADTVVNGLEISMLRASRTSSSPATPSPSSVPSARPAASERWDVRWVETVTTDTTRDLTRLRGPSRSAGCEVSLRRRARRFLPFARAPRSSATMRPIRG